MQLYLFAYYLLVIALCFALGASFFMLYLLYAGEKAEFASAHPYPGFSMGFLALLLTVASAILLYAFIAHEFRLEYVASYSSTSLPLFYRVTAFWAGRSGSMLFWAWSVALGGGLFAFVPAFKRLSLQTKLWHGLFFCSIMGFFLLILIGWSNPFAMLDFTPEDGRGLNPLLQNPGMIFHPPLLFLGYGGFVVPGCLALAQTLSGHLYDPPQGQRSEESWEQASRPFILGAWSLLTAGIVLGAWWAYMELGWGGYWAWDPVENASLIPWLVASAYLHTAVIGSRRGKLRRTNVFLMALTTISAFFATYLVRSGVVQSLHAFGEGDVGIPLMIFVLASLYFAWTIVLCGPGTGGKPPFALSAGICALIAALFTGILVTASFSAEVPFPLIALLAAVLLAAPWFYKRSPLKPNPLEELTSREGLLLQVAWLLLALSFIILVATMWPVIMSTLKEYAAWLPGFITARLPQNPVGLEPAFYNRTCLPLFALFAVLLVCCPYRKWKLPAAGSGFSQPKLFLAALGAALAFGLMLWFSGIRQPVALTAAACAVAAIIGIALYFIASPAQLSIRSTLAAHGVHIGLLLIILGVAFSGPYQSSHTLTLGRNEQAKTGNYTVTLSELYEGESQLNAEGKPNYIFIEAELLITDAQGAVVGKLAPQRRLYAGFEQQTYAEVSTLFSLGNELYATLLSLDDKDHATIMLNINPLVNWLWIGGTIMCLFPFAGLARVRRQKEDGHDEVSARA